jgi:hypothetical protein
VLQLSASTIIRRPLPLVFTTAADPELQLKWDLETLKRVEKLTPGPLNRGSRYRGEFKGMGTVEYEFADYEPNRRFSHHTVMPIGDLFHLFEFEAVPEGTRLTQSMRLEPKGIGKLIAPLMRGMLRKRLSTVSAELESYLGAK